MKLILALLCAVSSLPAAQAYPGWKVVYDPVTVTASPLQPMWRSALIPGWGQVYNGSKAKGVVLGLATLGLAAGTVYSYGEALKAQSDYTHTPAGRSQGDYDSAYQRWETWANVNNACYIGFGFAYAYTVLDAALHPRVKLMYRPRWQRLTVTPTPGGALLGYHTSF